jgi:hypothetical protein
VSFPAYHSVEALRDARDRWSERATSALADGKVEAAEALARIVDQADHEIVVRTRTLP